MLHYKYDLKVPVNIVQLTGTIHYYMQRSEFELQTLHLFTLKNEFYPVDCLKEKKQIKMSILKVIMLTFVHI